jgi:hypothetical protein
MVNTGSEWLEVGRIVAPQGLDGSLRVYPDSDFPERFLEPGDRWLLRPGQGEPEVVQLTAGRYLPGKGLYVVKLAGICDECKKCDWFLDPYCTYQNCHACGTESCYFDGNNLFSNDCILLSTACSSISQCSEYSDEECSNDPCGLGCNWDGGSCVEEMNNHY